MEESSPPGNGVDSEKVGKLKVGALNCSVVAIRLSGVNVKMLFVACEVQGGFAKMSRKWPRTAENS